MTTGARHRAWRIGGVAMLCAAGGIGTVHDRVSALARPLSASVETSFGLSAFLVAMAGVLMIIHGPRLRDRWRRRLARQAELRHAADQGMQTALTPAAPLRRCRRLTYDRMRGEMRR